jgi:4-oxalocrotonate tautomerase
MPHIIIYSPRLTREVKIACAEAVTRAFESTTGHSSELLTIHFEEHSYDNIAVGGKLLTDSFPELAEREKSFKAGSI